MNSHSIAPCKDAKELSSFVADINLTASASSTVRQAARFIRVEAVGGTATLVLTLAGPEGGVAVSRTFTVAAGWELIAEILGITASGTANVTRVTVGW